MTAGGPARATYPPEVSCCSVASATLDIVPGDAEAPLVIGSEQM